MRGSRRGLIAKRAFNALGYPRLLGNGEAHSHEERIAHHVIGLFVRLKYAVPAP